MITPGWKRRNDVCPVCHMPGRVGERALEGEAVSVRRTAGMILATDVCDNCGVVYAFRAEAAAAKLAPVASQARTGTASTGIVFGPCVLCGTPTQVSQPTLSNPRPIPVCRACLVPQVTTTGTGVVTP